MVKKVITEELILKWADEHHRRTGGWPKHGSGVILGTGGETWGAVEGALAQGTRGMPGGSSLAKFLAVHRGVRNHACPPGLTEKRILGWADAHRRRTGRWPVARGAVADAEGETWTAVDLALRKGSRGLPGGSSLAKLLAARRGVKNRLGQPRLTEAFILEWADEHHRRTGAWPRKNSGPVRGVKGENWFALDSALRSGSRGLPRGSSLARLLLAERGVQHRLVLSRLTEERVLEWADAHRRRTGEWPGVSSGPVAGAEGEKWSLLDQALREGHRGLPGGSSLPRLLTAGRGVRNRSRPPVLSEAQILAWADAHRRRTGAWPTRGGGAVEGADGEKWANIDTALQRGGRGLPGRSSLFALLSAERGVKCRADGARPRLTEAGVLAWADAHRRRTGKWPSRRSGTVPEAPGETWANVDNALVMGLRGLRGGMSLAKLLAARRGARYRYRPPELTEAQILEWADRYRRVVGAWPRTGSGVIPGTDGETWGAVDAALSAGKRGLPGGSSLVRLLAARRGARAKAWRPELTERQILNWADAHHVRTGHWPHVKSGSIPGVAHGESWTAVDSALRIGIRGFPGGSSLAMLLEARRGVKNRHAPPKLTEGLILEWADEHRRRTGKWPVPKSGAVLGVRDETWVAVDLALRRGTRGLRGGSSLARLLKSRGK